MHHYKNLPENVKCMKICQKQVFLCQKIQLFFILIILLCHSDDDCIIGAIKKCPFVNSKEILKITIVYSCAM